MKEKTNKLTSFIILIIVLIFASAVSIFIGIPLLKFVEDPIRFREFINSYGLLGRFIYIGIIVFQVIFAFVPGEPFELLAGYTFGTVEGTFLCYISSIIGSTIVFFLARKVGKKFVLLFFSEEKINSVKILNDQSKMYYLTFILYFIPGTPKDLLSYVAGLTQIKFVPYIIITTLAKTPSILTSTIGADALADKKYLFAILIFLITGIISLCGIYIYNKIIKK